MAKIQPKKKNLSASQQEEALKMLQKQDTGKKVIRHTVDVPRFLDGKIRKEIETSGQTVRGFWLALAHAHFAKKEQ